MRALASLCVHSGGFAVWLLVVSVVCSHCCRFPFVGSQRGCRFNLISVPSFAYRGSQFKTVSFFFLLFVVVVFGVVMVVVVYVCVCVRARARAFVSECVYVCECVRACV